MNIRCWWRKCYQSQRPSRHLHHYFGCKCLWSGGKRTKEHIQPQQLLPATFWVCMLAMLQERLQLHWKRVQVTSFLTARQHIIGYSVHKVGNNWWEFVLLFMHWRSAGYTYSQRFRLNMQGILNLLLWRIASAILCIFGPGHLSADTRRSGRTDCKSEWLSSFLTAHQHIIGTGSWSDELKRLLATWTANMQLCDDYDWLHNHDVEHDFHIFPSTML